MTIIDRENDGQATAAAAGVICPWMTKRRNKAWYELAKKGAKYYPTLIDQLALDKENETGYKKVGAMRLDTDKEKLLKLYDITMAKRIDAPEIGEIKLLSPQETKERYPLLDENYYSLYVSGGARVDGRLLRTSLLNAAIKHGARIVKGEAQLVTTNKTVHEVNVNGQTMYADQIIAVNGAWMPKLLFPLKINLTISAQKGEIIHLQMKDIVTEQYPVVMPPTNQYILHFDNGRIVVGSTHEKITQFDTHITAGGVHHILEKALKVAPNLKRAHLLETRVGFRPYTFNHLPVFGPLPGNNQLLIANGLGASGLTTGPFIGRQLAKVVLNEDLEVNKADYEVMQVIKS